MVLWVHVCTCKWKDVAELLRLLFFGCGGAQVRELLSFAP